MRRPARLALPVAAAGLLDAQPRARVLEAAVALAASTRNYNPDIITLGRDLYYNMRCARPHEASEQSRFALAAALKALEESEPKRL